MKNINEINAKNIGLTVKLPVSAMDRIRESTITKIGLHLDEKQYNKQYSKQSGNRLHVKKILLIAAVIIVLTATVAAHESIIAVFRNYYSESSLVVEKYNHEINTSSTQNGISFTVESIIRDEIGMYVFYKFTNNNGNFKGDILGSLTDVMAYYKNSNNFSGSLSSTSSLFGGPFDGLPGSEYTGMWYHADPDFDNSLTKVKNIEINIRNIFSARADKSAKIADFNFYEYLKENPELNGQQFAHYTVKKVENPMLERSRLGIELFDGDDEYILDNMGIIDGKLYFQVIRNNFQRISVPVLKLTDGVDMITADEEFELKSVNWGLKFSGFSLDKLGDLRKYKLVILDNEVIDQAEGQWHVEFDVPADKAPVNVIKPDENIVLENTRWNITEMRVSPVSAQIFLNTIEPRTPGDSGNLYDYPLVNVILKDGSRIQGISLSGNGSMRDSVYSVSYSYRFNKAFEFYDIKEIEINDKDDPDEVINIIDLSAYKRKVVR
jgi:hypothetical protein